MPDNILGDFDEQALGLADEYVERWLAGEAAATVERTRLLTVRHGALSVIARAIAPAVACFGELRESGVTDIADEQAAAAGARECLAAIRDATLVEDASGTTRRIVVFGPETEQHALPVLMAATALHAVGWPVRTLGTGCTPASAVAASRSHRAEVACMSVTTPEAVSSGVRVIQALVTTRPDMDVWVGGSALADEELADRLRAAGATAIGVTLVDLVKLIRTSNVAADGTRLGCLDSPCISAGRACPRAAGYEAFPALDPGE